MPGDCLDGGGGNRQQRRGPPAIAERPGSDIRPVQLWPGQLQSQQRNRLGQWPAGSARQPFEWSDRRPATLPKWRFAPGPSHRRPAGQRSVPPGQQRPGAGLPDPNPADPLEQTQRPLGNVESGMNTACLPLGGSFASKLAPTGGTQSLVGDLMFCSNLWGRIHSRCGVSGTRDVECTGLSRMNSLPQVCASYRLGSERKSPVGASLLAKTSCQVQRGRTTGSKSITNRSASFTPLDSHQSRNAAATAVSLIPGGNRFASYD